MKGRPKAPLELTDSEREQLRAWSLRRKTAQALAHRAELRARKEQSRGGRGVGNR